MIADSLGEWVRFSDHHSMMDAVVAHKHWLIHRLTREAQGQDDLGTPVESSLCKHDDGECHADDPCGDCPNG